MQSMNYSENRLFFGPWGASGGAFGWCGDKEFCRMAENFAANHLSKEGTPVVVRTHGNINYIPCTARKLKNALRREAVLTALAGAFKARRESIQGAMSNGLGTALKAARIKAWKAALPVARQAFRQAVKSVARHEFLSWQYQGVDIYRVSTGGHESDKRIRYASAKDIDALTARQAEIEGGAEKEENSEN